MKKLISKIENVLESNGFLVLDTHSYDDTTNIMVDNSADDDNSIVVSVDDDGISVSTEEGDNSESIEHAETKTVLLEIEALMKDVI